MIEKFNALPANAGKTQVSLASLLAGGELPDDVAQSSGNIILLRFENSVALVIEGSIDIGD